MRFGLRAAAFLMFLMASLVEAQITRHVPADFSSIQAAINAATNGDTVAVAPGTYRENIDFRGKRITLRSEAGPDVTIIDGGGNRSVARFVTAEDTNAVITGFTIQNGQSSTTDSGGIFVRASSPRILNNRIINNAGCGVSVSFGSPIIQGNTISHNACGEGAGVYLAGASSPQVFDNIISDNDGSLGGSGGIMIASANAAIRNNIIRGNNGYYGGGIFSDGFRVVIIQNLIFGNTAELGGGIYWLNPPAVVANNTIADNTSTRGSGAGLYAGYFDSSVSVFDNIFAANSGQDVLGCLQSTIAQNGPTFRNNIVFGSGIPAYASGCGNQTGIDGNLSNDPAFVAPDAGDYHVQPGSRAIDAGTSALPSIPSTDLDSNPRVLNGQIDIGAFEFDGLTTISIPTSALTFGNQLAGTVTTAQDVVIINTGSVALHISRFEAVGDFSVTDTCRTVRGVAPNGSCVVSVRFAPTTGGLRSGVINIYGNLAGIPPQIQLSGSAFAFEPLSIFSIPDRGGTSILTSGTSPSVAVGYSRIQPEAGAALPSGFAIFGYKPGSYLVSETGVPATQTLLSGRMYAEAGGAVNTGLAIANPNSEAATITFFYTDGAGNDLGFGTATIPAKGQIAKFIDALPFKTFSASTFQGTLSFTSTVPVAAMAIRSLYNERGDFLMATLPVIEPPGLFGSGPIVIPHFADGGGWTTQILLVNGTNDTLRGTIEFHNDSGTLSNLTIGGVTQNTFSYIIPPRSSQRFGSGGAGANVVTGSVRITPVPGNLVPISQVIFAYKLGGITVSHAGVSNVNGFAFRAYAEMAGIVGRPGNIQTGVAIANDSSTATTVTLELTRLDGTVAAAPVAIGLPAFGHTSMFLSQFFADAMLPQTFQGIVRISATKPISVVGLRGHYNELGDFLITTTPPGNESSPPGEMLFPQLADGGGYTTQIVLFGISRYQPTAGVLRFFDSSGQGMNLSLR